MTIAKDFASKAIVAFVAFAMIFTMFAPSVKAATTEEMQAQIEALLAQISALQGGSQSSSNSSSVCPFTWTRDLKTGASGSDVKMLQMFLNSNADTRVAASGAGSAGMETEFFGPATAGAVSKFQMMYMSDILTPAGLTSGTGYFGPSTRAKANSLCAVAMDDEDEDEDTDATDDEDEDDSDSDEPSGEGSLDSFEADDASDTDVQEGSEDSEIAELTLEAVDGDIEVDRLTFTIVGQSTPTEADPWDVFDTITLWVDGEMIGEFESDDEDNYLDEDDGEFRFSGLGLVLREDEEVEVTVAATVASNVDGAGSDAAWQLTAAEVRYFDADGVLDDDAPTTNELPTATADFDIVEEGDGEELTFGLGSANPDTTDIVVDTDDETNDVTILEYTIEAEEGDIELNTLFVKVITSTTSSLVIDDASIEIDGQTFDAENSASTTGVSSTFEFDVDGDVTIEDGEEVTVKVMVDLKSQESATNVIRYANGTTIQGTVTSVERDLTDAEGADDVDTFSGTSVGDTHNLVAEGILVPVDSVEATTDTSGENDILGEYTIEFDVTAVEGDFYITDNAAKGTSTQVASGVAFTYEGTNASSTGDVVAGTLSSTGDEETDGVFTVREGETETFTLRVTVNPVTAGDYRVTLEEVNYSENTNGTSAIQSYILTPAQDFRTGYETVQAS